MCRLTMISAFLYTQNRLLALPTPVLLPSRRGRDVLGGLLLSHSGREAVRAGGRGGIELCLSKSSGLDVASFYSFPGTHLHFLAGDKLMTCLNKAPAGARVHERMV